MKRFRSFLCLDKYDIEQKRLKEQVERALNDSEKLREQLAVLERELSSSQALLDASKLGEIKISRELNDLKSQNAAYISKSQQEHSRELRELNDQLQSTLQRVDEAESQRQVCLSKLVATEAELKICREKLEDHEKLKNSPIPDSQEDSVLMNLLTDELEEVLLWHRCIYYQISFCPAANEQQRSFCKKPGSSGFFGELASSL